MPLEGGPFLKVGWLVGWLVGWEAGVGWMGGWVGGMGCGFVRSRGGRVVSGALAAKGPKRAWGALVGPGRPGAAQVGAPGWLRALSRRSEALSWPENCFRALLWVVWPVKVVSGALVASRRSFEGMVFGDFAADIVHGVGFGWACRPQFPGVWWGFPGVPRSLVSNARSCTEFPGVARSYPEFPGVARSCPELHGVARSCPELQLTSDLRFCASAQSGPVRPGPPAEKRKTPKGTCVGPRRWPEGPCRLAGFPWGGIFEAFFALMCSESVSANRRLAEPSRLPLGVP